MNTDSCIVYIKTDDICKDITEDVETRFYTSIYELIRRLPKGIKKKVTELMKDDIGGKIMIEFVWLRAKTYNYLIDDGSERKKAKVIQKCAKRKLENYKSCLKANQLENKVNH